MAISVPRIAVLITLLAACENQSTVAPDMATPFRTVHVTATVDSTRFVTREAFLAAGEMQISGEPLAEAMGRDLGGYSRDHVPANIYFDPGPLAPASGGGWIDLPGFSTGVESYEYSKQPMNNVAFESGAGTSMVHGPLVDPAGTGGTAAKDAMAARVQHYAQGSNAYNRFVFDPDTYPTDATVSGNPNLNGTGMPSENPLGWPGIWPTVHIFADFDPTIAPSGEISLGCAVTSDDDPGATGALGCADYECSATTLHLSDRKKQINATISPGADGWNAWKYGLWVLNYLQVMHDSTEAGVLDVGETNLAGVGTTGNVIAGFDDASMPTAPGTFLGSSDIEGFQAQMFLDELDNRAEDWIKTLTTTDGVSLSGFASTADALAYDYTAPLRWFPGAISVAETDDASGFPKPSYSLKDASSTLLDLDGLALGFAEIYSLTDTRNTDVGGAQTAVAFFDGDPFLADNQLADGEPTLHDRALAVIRVAIVDLDRLHTDPTSGLLVDSVTMNGSAPTRGTTVSTTSVAYTLLTLRTVARSLSSQLELYSNNTPDTAIATTPLDTLPIHHPSDANLTFTARIQQLVHAESELLFTHLTDATGRAYAGWDVAVGKPTSMDDTLDAHTAAIRGLFAAYLATGDTRFHDRALLVYARMEQVFYDAEARMYDSSPAPMDTVTYTPLRFALLQSALRDMYELVAARPGGASLELTLEERFARLDKLVLNGWDDRNGNRLVEWPDECVNVVGGLPRGGLQMAERTLTGEVGSFEEQLMTGQTRTPTSDREHDCVPEIDDAKLPAALASSVTFHLTRQ